MFTFASEETYGAGQVIFKEGSTGNWVYVILSGSVELTRQMDGKKYIIETLNKGEVLGELSFLGGIKRTATATAVKETTLGVLDREFLDFEYNKISSEFRLILVSAIKRFEGMLNRAKSFSSRMEERHQKVLTVSYKNKDAFIMSYTSNISGGGLFIKTHDPIEKGERVLINLKLLNPPASLKISSEVIWTRKTSEATDILPAGMGVRFLKMSDKDQHTLKGILNEILDKSKNT